MPYINEQFREQLESREPENAGELNYMITKKLLAYLQVNGKSYKTYNEIVGALESCKLEFYRRLIADFEDTKIIQNGDIINGHTGNTEHAE